MSAEAAFRWQSASKSIVGNVRELNEDACLDLPARGLWVVADGMGGHQAGDVASQMVVQELGRIEPHDRFSAFIDDVEDRLLKVNSNLFAMANHGPEPQVIGCTFAGMLAFGGHCLAVWAGDSRVYRRRGEELLQITRDHSEVQEMIASGVITEEAAKTHPAANVITRAVGGVESLHLDLRLEPIADGDRYLICSDGLYKDLEAAEIGEALGRGTCLEACAGLISTVESRECADNVSVIVVDFASAPSDVTERR